MLCSVRSVAGLAVNKKDKISALMMLSSGTELSVYRMEVSFLTYAVTFQPANYLNCQQFPFTLVLSF